MRFLCVEPAKACRGDPGALFPSARGRQVAAGGGDHALRSNSFANLQGSLTLHGKGGSDTNYADEAAILRTGIASAGALTLETVNLISDSNTMSMAALSPGTRLTGNARVGDEELVANSTASVQKGPVAHSSGSSASARQKGSRSPVDHEPESGPDKIRTCDLVLIRDAL
jgi:hypothetical protein